MKQVIIEQVNDAIVVLVDGKRTNFMEDESLTTKQKSMIQRKMYELEQRNIRRSIFKI